MKILTIVGARPQFIKAGVVSKAIRAIDGMNEKILHTGQHFDANMSDIFFGQLGIPKPDYALDINGGSHGEMTGRMLIEIERVLIDEKPDCVLVFGDTNSTLAGALAASKMHITVAHIEAGLRSYNMAMPEEINRICTDMISNVLFCPTDQAIENLEKEGFANRDVKIVKTGDVMMDSALQFKSFARKPSALDLDGGFVLATCHRQENTDDPKRLSDIIQALNAIHNDVAPVVCPLHPRTLNCAKKLGLDIHFYAIDPVGYLEMLWLLSHCNLVLTDSGGLQKEAFFMQKYCLTLRDQTEWLELIKEGGNTLVGADKDKIIAMAKQKYGVTVPANPSLYGDGQSSKQIADYLSRL